MTPLMTKLYKELCKPKHRRRLIDQAGVVEKLSHPMSLVVDMTDVRALAFQQFDDYVSRPDAMMTDAEIQLEDGMIEESVALMKSHQHIWLEYIPVCHERPIAIVGTYCDDETIDISLVRILPTVGFISVNLHDDNTAHIMRKQGKDIQGLYEGYMQRFFAFINFIISQSGDISETVTPKPSHIKHGKCKPPEGFKFTHRVARLVVDGKRINVQRTKSEHKGVLPYHMVIGHTHTYHTLNGPIKKFVQAFWRGNREVGVVTKTYKAEMA